MAETWIPGLGYRRAGPSPDMRRDPELPPDPAPPGPSPHALLVAERDRREGERAVARREGEVKRAADALSRAEAALAGLTAEYRARLIDPDADAGALAATRSRIDVLRDRVAALTECLPAMRDDLEQQRRRLAWRLAADPT